MPGDDRVGELDDASSTSAHVAGSPWNASGVTPKKQRSPAKQHVGVGDEHDDVAGGVPARGQHLDARRELRRVVDQVRDRAGPELGEVVELLLERGHERLVRVERHRAGRAASLVCGDA